MDIKLICMDLDGTALRSDHHTFSPRLEQALDRAHEKGITIVPVTGRQYGLLPPAVTGHPAWETLVVTCTGGQILRLGTGELLYSLDIEETALRQLLAIAERFHIPVEFSRNSKLHLTQASYDAEAPQEILSFHVNTILAKSGVIVSSLEPMCTARIEKALYPWIPPELSKPVEEALKEAAVSAVWSSSTSMEITHPDANKGMGLSALCRLLGIDTQQTMAIGDSGNDASMLRAAGLGVAMGNAPAHIKALADAVTETNENDGAAIAIEQYCL